MGKRAAGAAMESCSILSPEEVVRLLDLSYLEEVLGENDALALLGRRRWGAVAVGWKFSRLVIRAMTPPSVGWHTTMSK